MLQCGQFNGFRTCSAGNYVAFRGHNTGFNLATQMNDSTLIKISDVAINIEKIERKKGCVT